jgi:uncharacterized protein
MNMWGWTRPRTWAANLSLVTALAFSGLTGSGWRTPAAAAPFADYHPAPQFSGALASSFYLPMRDGVRLAVRLYRPTEHGQLAPGRFPVIWHGTLDIGDSGPGAHSIPTGVRFGTEPAPEQPRWEPARDLSSLTRHGYAVAIVARRGSGASFGRRRGYEDVTEADDAYEITEWLARQPWSSGAVGVYGCSNTGEAAMHVLTVRPPHLKAVWAGCFSFNRYDGFTRGGIIANWGAGPQRSLAEDLKATPVDGDADRKLLAQAAQEHQGSTYLLDLMKGMPYRDSWSDLTMSRFWAEASISSYLDQMRQSGAALYIQAGWRDDFRQEGLIAFANYPADRRYIVIGDWTHCSNLGFDLRSEQLRFYDHYLKGVDTGIEQGPPIHYALVHAPKGQEWRTSWTWPVAGEGPQTLYLGPGGTLDIQPARPSRAEPLQVRYDLHCPDAPTDPALVALSQPCHPSSGSVSWTGPAARRDRTLTGSPVVRLTLASSTPDARVFAYLEDVSPDGVSSVITDARLDLKLRKTATPPWDNLGLPWHPSTAVDASPMPENTAEPVRIAFLPVAYVLKAGHRLQLTIAGADPRERARPQSDPAPVLRIGQGGADGSSLILPVVGG